MQNKSVLITGATGILGSWVLGEALDRGYKPIALMRDPDLEHARTRLARVLHLTDREEHLDGIEIVLGDACGENLGLSEDAASDLRASLGGMIHCAASTSFDPNQDEVIWSTNVGGVKNVLKFLRGSGIPLYHVSSAYVAGCRSGEVLETEIDMGQDFRNTYERSKCTSENLVREAMAKGEICGAVFRPSIIVGATQQGRIGQFLSFYNFLRIIDVACRRRPNGRRELQLEGNPFGTKNMVPVDWTAKALWHIIESEGPLLRTYHLTNPDPPAHHFLLDWANDLLRPRNTCIEMVDELEEDGRRFGGGNASALREYFTYLEGGEPRFDRTNTDRALGGAHPFPKMDHEFFSTILEYARRQSWRSIFRVRNGKRASEKANSPATASEAAVRQSA